jgi:hypothetical protein
MKWTDRPLSIGMVVIVGVVDILGILFMLFFMFQGALVVPEVFSGPLGLYELIYFYLFIYFIVVLVIELRTFCMEASNLLFEPCYQLLWVFNCF